MIVCLCVCFGCGAKNNDVDANGNVNDTNLNSSLNDDFAENSIVKDTNVYMNGRLLNLSALDNASQPTVNDVSVLDSVHEGMTLESALELLGKARPDESSTWYPLHYSWIVGDGILYMVFETDNNDEFWQGWHNGDYVLEDEILEYDENGLRIVTKHELEVLREHRLNHKATSAYVMKDSVKTTLFDKASQSKTNDDNALARQPTVNDVSVLDSVQEGMTLKSALELLGKARPNEFSTYYPLNYSWIVGDGILYMVFKSENHDEFWQAWCRGDYVLEDEILEYGENGIRKTTKHELEVLLEHNLNNKATSAYVKKDGVITTLF
jgi:hypothetical protein